MRTSAPATQKGEKVIVDLERKWVIHAKCSGAPVKAFFCGKGYKPLQTPGPETQRTWNKAKVMCLGCPVINECARDSLGEQDGVWGGMDPVQRREARGLHSRYVRVLSGERKVEYAALAASLKRRYSSWEDVARIIGVGIPTARYLVDWHAAHLAEQDASPVTGLGKPESVPRKKVGRQHGTKAA